MTTLHIGHAPRRVRQARRIALLGVLGVAVTVAATLLSAAAVRRMFGYAPINVSDWLIALIALVGLASNLAVPGRRERVRRTAKRAAARPSTVLGSTRRPPLRRMWRLRRPMPGLTTLPPVGG